MTFDALTMAAVRDEIAGRLTGGRVQHVHLPEELGLAIEVYAAGERHWIVCSAHPQRARIHLAAARPGRPSDAVSPLLLLLRKYVDGARLEAVEQPPLERILRLRFGGRAPDGTWPETTLVVEIMGRHSNLILLDAGGSVMDAAKRVTAEINRVRQVLPRSRYVPPPPQMKLDPRQIEGQRLAAAAAGYDPGKPLRELLVAEVAACSPLLARETAARAGGAGVTVGEADLEAAAAALRGFWADAAAGRWAPTVAYEGDHLVAFAPYRLTSFAGVRPAGSISEAVAAWFERLAPPADADEARKRPLRQALEAAVDRLRAKRYSLQQGLVDPAAVDRLRRAGQALLAYGAGLAPGSTSFQHPETGETFALDPALTTVENAQRYFARYLKAKTAAREVPAMIEQVENEMRYLDDALTHLELASSPAELKTLRDEWAELGYVARGRADRSKRAGQVTRKGRGTPSSGPTGYERMQVQGFDVLVGRSGRGNDVLLGCEAHPEDVWLHARGVPGAHVLIRSRGRDVPEPVLRQAAALAAARSQARRAPVVGVDYTRRKYVDRIKGAPPGLVRYRGERTLHVAPADFRPSGTND